MGSQESEMTEQLSTHTQTASLFGVSPLKTQNEVVGWDALPGPSGFKVYVRGEPLR